MDILQTMRLSEDATLPVSAHEDDAGFDICASKTVVLAPQDKYVVPTDIAVNIPPGYVGFLTSRSGVSSKSDLVVETGKIDAGFTGPLGVNVKNDSQEDAGGPKGTPVGEAPLLYDVKGEKVKNGNPYAVTRGRTYIIEKGDRIAQLVLTPIVKPKIKEVSAFEETARGTNAYGSTGWNTQKLKGGTTDGQKEQ